MVLSSCKLFGYPNPPAPIVSQNRITRFQVNCKEAPKLPRRSSMPFRLCLSRRDTTRILMGEVLRGASALLAVDRAEARMERHENKKRVMEKVQERVAEYQRKYNKNETAQASPSLPLSSTVDIYDNILKETLIRTRLESVLP